MQIGEVLDSEIKDIEPAIARLLDLPTVRELTSRRSFDRFALMMLNTYYANHSAGFRAWVTAKAWSRHEEERVLLELSIPELFALRDAALSMDRQSDALISAIRKMTDRLTTGGYEKAPLGAAPGESTAHNAEHGGEA